VRRLEVVTGAGSDSVTIGGPVTLAGDGTALADVRIQSRRSSSRSGREHFVAGGQVVLEAGTLLAGNSVAVRRRTWTCVRPPRSDCTRKSVP